MWDLQQSHSRCKHGYCNLSSWQPGWHLALHELPVRTFWQSIRNLSGLNISSETVVQFTVLFIAMT